MFVLFRRKPKDVAVPIPADPIVDHAKQRIHDAAGDAKVNTDRLNKVFKQNGITLNILRTAGGGHEH
jgi:hypothetical protein